MSLRTWTAGVLTATSMRPCLLPIAAASASTALASPASTTWLSAPPGGPMSAATRSTPSRSLSAQTTVAPSAASASALARPMPEAAPSTSATLRSRRNRSRYAASLSSISAIATSTRAALLGHRLKLLHVVAPRIGGDPLIGRRHQGAERREVRPRDLHAEPFDLPDLILLLVADQLTHEVAGGRAFLPQDRLLAGIELRPGARAHRVDHVVVDVPG